MQGFSRILRPRKFAANEADLDWVRQAGNEIVTKGLVRLSDQLGQSTFIMGPRLSITNAALFYTLFWATERTQLALKQNLRDYFQRLRARPSARKVLKAEGLA